MPSEFATPLALALTELVTNAVEHRGFPAGSSDGQVAVTVERDDDNLAIQVRDNGVGMVGGHEGSGLGTQIVRTLVSGELGGAIAWQENPAGGTLVQISIPRRQPQGVG